MSTMSLPNQTGVFAAETEAQRRAIYRFRYHHYVEGMGRYRSTADHENRLLIEDCDDQSRLYYAIEGGELAATMRLTWGGDAPFPQRQAEQYGLDLFAGEVPPEKMIVGERFAVAKAWRGTDVLFRMFCACLELANENRVELVFGDCEPHLLNLYLGLGFRTYSRRNVNSSETGYLIPLLMVPEDLAYLERINSPLLGALRDFGAEARVPPCVERLLAKGSAVLSQRLVPHERYWSEIYDALNRLDETSITLFDGLSPAETQECLAKSSIIECRTGDRLIKKGHAARNLFIVLAGILEVGDRETPVAVLNPGDVFGEVAFLLGQPRSMDVYAASDDVRVLSLSENAIRKMIAINAEVAAKLLLNISKMLCKRLVRSA